MNAALISDELLEATAQLMFERLAISRYVTWQSASRTTKERYRDAASSVLMSIPDTKDAKP